MGAAFSFHLFLRALFFFETWSLDTVRSWRILLPDTLEVSRPRRRVQMSPRHGTDQRQFLFHAYFIAFSSGPTDCSLSCSLGEEEEEEEGGDLIKTPTCPTGHMTSTLNWRSIPLSVFERRHKQHWERAPWNDVMQNLSTILCDVCSGLHSSHKWEEKPLEGSFTSPVAVDQDQDLPSKFRMVHSRTIVELRGSFVVWHRNEVFLPPRRQVYVINSHYKLLLYFSRC